MREVEAEGKTVEEAIGKALAELNATIEEVEVKIIDEGKAGLFGLMGAAPARVKMGKKEVAGAVLGLSAKAKHIVAEILNQMNINGDTEVTIEEKKIVVNIDSLEGALLIGKKGQTLEAFQYVVNLMINREIKAGLIKGITLEDKYKIIVDTEGYRIRREETLIKMALNMAEKVKSSGQKADLEPMSAHDRRVVHMALQDIQGVKTESEGDGSFRRIVIYPTSQ